MDGRVAAALIVAAAVAGWGMRYAWRTFCRGRFFGTVRRSSLPRTAHPATALIDAALADTGASISSPVSSQEMESDDHLDLDLPCLEAGHLPEASASAVVREWARGRRCAMCHGPVTESWFAGHHIALLEPTGMTREWVDVGADRLALALATSLPLCWNCHVAATFRRMHPELVTDRDDRTIQVKQD